MTDNMSDDDFFDVEGSQCGYEMLHLTSPKKDDDDSSDTQCNHEQINNKEYIEVERILGN